MGFFDNIAYEGGFFRRSSDGFFSVSPQASFAYVQRQLDNQRLYSKQRLDGVAVNAIDAAAFDASASLGGILGNAMAQMSGDLQQAIKAFSENSKYLINRRQGWSQAMQKVGREAQDAILDSYRSKAKGPRYRVGINRYAGGALENALGDSSFFLASRDGLRFINTGMLNTRAKQWARYNYGARPKGSIGSNKSFPIQFFGQNVGRLGLDRGPSPEFTVPRGVFIDASGKPLKRSEMGPRAWGKQDRFFTVRQYNALPSLRKMGHKEAAPDSGTFFGPLQSKGIVGRRIFDAGVGHIAYAMPREFERLITTSFKDAAEGAPRGGYGPLGKAGLPPSEAARHLRTLNLHFS